MTANNLDSISAARSNAPSIINNRPSTGDLLPTKVNRGGANESDRVSSEFEHFTIDSDYGTVIRGKGKKLIDETLVYLNTSSANRTISELGLSGFYWTYRTAILRFS